METNILQAVFAGHGQAYHILTAIKKPAPHKMHENKEPKGGQKNG